MDQDFQKPTGDTKQRIINIFVIFFVTITALFTIYIVMAGPFSDVLTSLTYDGLKCGANMYGSSADGVGIRCECFGVMTSKHYESSRTEQSCFGKCYGCAYPDQESIKRYFPEYLKDTSI